METKHTPGPWRLSGSDNATPHVISGDAVNWEDAAYNGGLICAMPAEIMRNYNSWANARLIAAAPELLEALKAILNAEPHSLHVGYDHCGGFVYADVVRLDDEAFNKARAAIARATGASS